MHDGENYMTTKQAAAYLGLSDRTLESYRSKGGGPAFHYFGRRVLYLLDDLREWAAERRRSSTSDSGNGPGGRRSSPPGSSPPSSRKPSGTAKSSRTSRPSSAGRARSRPDSHHRRTK